MYTPTVVFKEGYNEDTDLLTLYLYHKTPNQKQRLIQTYPELAFASVDDEKKARPKISDFVNRYLHSHKDDLDRILLGIKENLSKAPHALEMTGTLMEYDWPSRHGGYTFIPTLLPFSPWDFETNTVYLSLLPYLNNQIDTSGQKQTVYLDATQTLVHEVTHFILRDKVVKLNVPDSSNDTVLHFVQEILAPVLMNQPELHSFLNLNDYWGNLYLNPIVFHTKKGNVHMVDYFFEEYSRFRREGGAFNTYVLRIFATISALGHELEDRMMIWNQNGKKIFEDKSLWEVYTKPIIAPD